MKKIIYAVLISIASTLAFTSCTEEEVKPDTTLSNGGGGGITGRP